MDQPFLYLLLVVAGIAAGFINTLAGGGSMLTLPLLMLLGLPANVANGSNRLAVVTQSIVGVWSFRRRGKLDETALLSVIGPTVVGAIAGAGAAAMVPAAVLKYVLLGTMMTVACVMTLVPRTFADAAHEANREGPADPMDRGPRGLGRRLARLAGMFAAGVYGGFVQAGVGFLLLAVLGGLWRYDLVRANALKLACVAIFSMAALAIFIAAGQIAWAPAVVLALATPIGSNLGVRFAVGIPAKILRWVVLAMVLVACVAALVKAG